MCCSLCSCLEQCLIQSWHSLNIHKNWEWNTKCISYKNPAKQMLLLFLYHRQCNQDFKRLTKLLRMYNMWRSKSLTFLSDIKAHTFNKMCKSENSALKSKINGLNTTSGNRSYSENLRVLNFLLIKGKLVQGKVSKIRQNKKQVCRDFSKVLSLSQFCFYVLLNWFSFLRMTTLVTCVSGKLYAAFDFLFSLVQDQTLIVSSFTLSIEF